MISKGNYNSSNFIIELTNEFLKNAHIFTITFNKINGILTFNSQMSFTFLSISTIKNIIGFDSDINSFNNSVIMPYPLNLSGKQQLKIISNNITTNNFDNSSTNTILNVVYVDNFQYGIQNYKFNDQMNLLKTKSLNYFDIHILDENNNYINFNNLDWCLTFRLIKYKYIDLASNKLYDYLMNKTKKEILDDDTERFNRQDF
jgi:hypothetical protein